MTDVRCQECGGSMWHEKERIMHKRLERIQEQKGLFARLFFAFLYTGYTPEDVKVYLNNNNTCYYCLTKGSV